MPRSWRDPSRGRHARIVWTALYHRRAAASWPHAATQRYHADAVQFPLRLAVPTPGSRGPLEPRSIACSQVAWDRTDAADPGDDLEHLRGFRNRRLADVNQIARQNRKRLGDEESTWIAQVQPIDHLRAVVTGGQFLCQFGGLAAIDENRGGIGMVIRQSLDPGQRMRQGHGVSVVKLLTRMVDLAERIE